MNFKDISGKIKKHYIISNLVALVIAIMLVAVGVTYGLDLYTQHGEEIEIPDLKNKLISEVREELRSLDLNICVSDTGYIKKLPDDCILDQIPKAGTKTKSGHTIYVIINSASSPYVTIPDLIDNSSLREAEAKLRALGFKLAPAKQIQGEKDWVYGIECGGKELSTGEKVRAEKTLRVVVGDGSNIFDDDDAEVMSDSLIMEYEETPEDFIDESESGGTDDFEEIL